MKSTTDSVKNISCLTSALVLAFTPVLQSSAAPLNLAQAAEVKGAPVQCDNPKATVNIPGIKVSAPNPSKLVPNVGRILREGVGVPAPDAIAPDVSAKASAKAPAASCPTDRDDPGQTTSQAVPGLW